MKIKFAPPSDRDQKFCRNSKLRPDDFGQEVKIIDSAANGLVIVLCLIVLAAATGLLS